jgi:hypothetical protein
MRPLGLVFVIIVHMLEREMGMGLRQEREREVTLEDALRESAGAGLVYKPDTKDISGSIEERLPDLDDATREKLEKYEGSPRLLGHLFRLLEEGRSPEEKQFANIILDQYRGLEDERKGMMDDEAALTEKFQAQTRITDFDDYAMAFDALEKIPEGDSADTVMWWTFSPYIAESLHADGVADKEILERLMAWGLPAAEKSADESSLVHLPGLEFVNNNGRAQTYILSPDPEGASHAFTRQNAKELTEAGLL